MKKGVVRFAGVAVLLAVLALMLCAQQNEMAVKAQAAYDKKAFADAGPLFLLAAQFEPRGAYVHLYNAACSYALSGQKDLAFFSLDASIARGWRDKKQTESDEDLASLRGDPRWKDMIASVSTGTMQSNKDAVINDLNNLAAMAYQYRLRPRTMGGGEGTYVGFKILEKMVTNSNATYEVLAAKDSLVQYKATSVNGFGTVETSIDATGRLGGWKYTGAFYTPPPVITPLVSNRDALINDLNNLAAYAYQYRIRPTSMGGGNGAYTGVAIPERMKSNENGSFTFTVVGPDELKMKAVSAEFKDATIETTLNAQGRMGNWLYTGEFK